MDPTPATLFVDEESKNVKFWIPGEGVPKEIYCHADVVSARSPVLKEILATDLEEGKTTKTCKVVELDKGIGQAAVELFVRYAYFGEINLDEVTPNVALELLKFVQRYQVADLLHSVSNSLIARNPETYSPDILVEIYSLAKDTASLGKLKERTIEIMRTMQYEVKWCKTYQDLMISFPMVALDLPLDLFEDENADDDQDGE